MRYYKSIFIDKDLGDIKSVKEIFSSGFAIYNAYVLYVNKNSKGLFEISYSGDILKRINRFNDCGIIAVTRGKAAAGHMAKELIEDWFNDHGSLAGIKEYYDKNCE